jgi:Heme exporter protein D (CcmD)
MIAMTHAAYVAAGWGGAAVVVAAYGAWVLRRGRALSREVPAEERRWS